jgi:hypothetical protein
MKRTTALAAAVAALLASGAETARAWSGDANVLLGGKRLDGEQWGPAFYQGELGVLTSVAGSGWPAALAVDYFAASKHARADRTGFTERYGRTSELHVGARKFWRADRALRPYIGGGVAYSAGRLEFRGPGGTISDRGDGAGAWLGGGFEWRLASALNVGLDTRLSRTDARLFGSEFNLGGYHLDLFLGYHWSR